FPPPPARTAPAPPAPQPDSQGKLAAPLVTAAEPEQRPTPPHGAPVELVLGAAGATLLADGDSGRDNLEEAWAGMECGE
ncbi:MAG: hypothetical protein ACO31X_10385, partial [Candidatus Nanopelagicales bacterium]